MKNKNVKKGHKKVLVTFAGSEGIITKNLPTTLASTLMLFCTPQNLEVNLTNFLLFSVVRPLISHDFVI